jgi:hypothetical protein
MQIARINKLYEEIAAPDSWNRLRAVGEDGSWNIMLYRPGRRGEKRYAMSDAEFFKFLEENPEIRVIAAMDFTREIVFAPGVFPEGREALLTVLKNLIESGKGGEIGIKAKPDPGSEV